MKHRGARWRFAGYSLFVLILALALLEIGLHFFFRYAEMEQATPANEMPPDAATAAARYEDAARRNEPISVRDGEGRRLLTPDETAGAGNNIFLLGGSAMYGVGVRHEDAFDRVLIHQLADPANVRVFNCGRIAANSEAVAATAASLLANYKVDLLIVYSGNNEFLHWYFPLTRVVAGVDWAKASRFLGRHSRIYRSMLFFHRLYRSDFLPWSQPPMREQWDAAPFRRDCTRMLYDRFRAFDPQSYFPIRDAYVRNFQDNLRWIVRRARTKNIPVVLTTLPFRITLPVCYMLRQPLGIRTGERNQETLARSVRQAATAIDAKRPREALALLAPVIAVEPEAPLPRYVQAQAYEALGETDQAIDAYSQARERVFGNLGSMLSLNRAIREVAAEEGAPLAEIREAIERTSRDDGDPYVLHAFVDYCHLTPKSTRTAIAETVRTMRAAGLTP